MRDILLKTNRFLAHGFTANSPNGSLSQIIEYSINNSNSHELCVCTVASGDHSRRNYFQPVGLIIGNCDEVTYCRNKDGGTIRMMDGELIGHTEGGFFNPSPSEIENSILNRPVTTYNEFRIKNYEVAGFYISKDEEELAVVSSIITNEYLFYNQTSHYRLPYYFVVSGALKEVAFDPKNQQFNFIKEKSNWELYNK